LVPFAGELGGCLLSLFHSFLRIGIAEVDFAIALLLVHLFAALFYGKLNDGLA